MGSKISESTRGEELVDVEQEAIIHAVRYPGPLRDFYIKHEKRKGKKIARVAAARKLSIYIYHMLKEKKDYQAVTRYLKSDLE